MNSKFSTQSPISFPEFVTLVAMMSALVALAIDAILPALPDIRTSLALTNDNDAQLVIAFLFIGMAIGPIIFGPLSDSIGRKPAIVLGLLCFLAGTLICWLSHSFEQMLAGRILQGLGAAGPRTVSMAMVRDLFEGTDMARVISFVTAVFILVPALAPSVGQAILQFTSWHGIFVFFLVLGLIILVWFSMRQRETLPQEKRSRFHIETIIQSVKTVVATKTTLCYTVAIGCLFGGFLGYLYSSQQIFQDIYLTGDKFPLYFALLALAFGASSLANAQLVIKYGMEKLSLIAVQLLVFCSVVFFIICLLSDGAPPFFIFMIYATIGFVSIALAFGNLNALAMEPMGRIAGIAAAIISAISTLISLPLGLIVGQSFNMTVIPLTIGFTLFGSLAWFFIIFSQRGSKQNLPIPEVY
ncbi:multidrug effflux MFS transporter [Endozoicomonas sp. SM1973]|uniref:Bcr/CflA family efflux transporter n=1 Tax=Spartinivicinus marinus TaxID=2994442 RepID=A0A853I9S5_9GAMM|nr:multidrug effflux MFS transporter [Spartinivicinus marinus]MCX4026442.1 multidrug effflux MFS transporter [Spartinivicinus marinus]NYZ66814.1 multidrug effflux MFS transporter [Spartinivicinus marinus]